VQRRVALGQSPGLSRAKLTFMSLSHKQFCRCLPRERVASLSAATRTHSAARERPLLCVGREPWKSGSDFLTSSRAGDPASSADVSKPAAEQHYDGSNRSVNKQCHAMAPERGSRSGVRVSHRKTQPQRQLRNKNKMQASMGSAAKGILLYLCSESHTHTHTHIHTLTHPHSFHRFLGKQ
jgi:hypothetical protein